MTYNEVGTLVACTDTEGNVEDPSQYSNGVAMDVTGIWDANNECTIPWDEVVDYKNTDFHLTGNMYLDNGQVVDEGLIVEILVDGASKWKTSYNGGCDTSGFTGDNNVYCEDCEKQYEVKGITPQYCSNCGSPNIYLKEEN